MSKLNNLNIKIFSDGADLNDMVRVYREGIVDGFTTNPTLMKRSGVVDYGKFAKDILAQIQDLPISFEVFSDAFAEMEREARIISSWGKNVFVKIPVTNTKGESSAPLIKRLSADGLQLNVTALLTIEQVSTVAECLSNSTPSIISVFAGRIADTGVDPVPQLQKASLILKDKPAIQLLWASTREMLNIFQAQSAGCQIITVTNDILKKISLLGMDLNLLSLDTVKMFYKDAQTAGYKL